MFISTILMLISSTLDGAAIDPCSRITAPPIVMHAMHAGPIEIAVAWHTPVDGDAPLQPPLEALGDRCDGQERIGPGSLEAGDAITQGALSNLGDSTIFILTTEGELIRIPSGQSLWIGDDGGLTPTHQCMCICTCSGYHFSRTIVTHCNGLGGCARTGEACDILDQDGEIQAGTISDCRVVYAPIDRPTIQ